MGVRIISLRATPRSIRMILATLFVFVDSSVKLSVDIAKLALVRGLCIVGLTTMDHSLFEFSVKGSM